MAVATLGVDAVMDSVQQAVRHARRSEYPFCHWQLHDILPGPVVRAMSLLPAAPMQGDNLGRRETHNASRRFLDPALQAQSPACADVAAALQSAALVECWQDLCGISLRGSFLRVEYCQDGGGFWLEPHTDIGAKLFTLLIYLVDPPAGECWGTDLLHPDGTLAVRATGAANSGVLFIPHAWSWHGFAPRPISGVRRTLIVNYVVADWRARHELCFAGRAVG